MTTTSFPTRRPMASLRRNPAAPLRHVDALLIGCIGAVGLLGALMIFSATRGDHAPYQLAFVKKQLMFLILGGMAMIGVAAIDYRRIRDVAVFVYGVPVFLLLAVITPLGSFSKGSQRWFPLGPFQLQPSEMAKLGLVVGLAALASQFGGDIGPRRLGALLAVAGLPMGLVLLQPDLGTALVSAAITLAMLLMAGVKGRHLAVLLVVGVLGATFMLHSGVLKQYQKDRLTVFVNQGHHTKEAARGAAYNLGQAKIAIGAGGVAGQGLFKGSQTRLGVVPEQHTDFIFTAVGEELGFAGGATLLALMAIIVWRVWRTAQLAQDSFGTLLCAGIMAMFVFQTFENIGMTMGIMPITGIPLPFVSYGGSSIITVFLAMGLVLSVHMRRFS